MKCSTRLIIYRFHACKLPTIAKSCKVVRFAKARWLAWLVETREGQTDSSDGSGARIINYLFGHGVLAVDICMNM